MKILLIGKSGQLAKAFSEILPDAIFLSRSELDLEKPELICDILSRYDCDAIINTAAYTQVDQAESNTELANKINANSPAIIAQYAKDKNIPFIHFSTDYVVKMLGLKPINLHQLMLMGVQN
jgi:dTDP-4-dehydrorhamnose reductase